MSGSMFVVATLALAAACKPVDDGNPPPIDMSAGSVAITAGGVFTDGLADGGSTDSSGSSGSSGSGSSDGGTSAGAPACVDGEVCEVDGTCITIFIGTSPMAVCTHGATDEPCFENMQCASGVCDLSAAPEGGNGYCT